jgi:capsule polysaccharide modification protein KpsS
MKKWWKDPIRKEQVSKKISDTLRNKNKLTKEHESVPEILHRSFRRTYECWIWKRKVLEKGNYQCVQCKFQSSKRKKIKNVDAHHIIPVAQIFKDRNIKTLEKAKKDRLLNAVSNGQVLCRKCHKEHHKNKPEVIMI